MTTPYVYILRHKPSDLYYIGCRFAKNCDPSELLQIDGYCTSSTAIHKIIERDGLDSLEIVTILLEQDCKGLSVYDYETKYLKDNNIAQDDRWINAHNNERPAFGSAEFSKILQEKYGVSNATYIPRTDEWRKKFSATQKVVQNSPERRLTNSQQQKIAQNRPEVQQKKRVSMQKKMQEPDTKKKHKDACNSPQFKESQKQDKEGSRFVYNPDTLETKRTKDYQQYLDAGWKAGFIRKSGRFR